MSEALIFASTSPQYDNRMFIELRVNCTVHEYCKLRICREHVAYTNCFFVFDIQNNLCTQNVLDMFWTWNFHVLNSRPGTRNSMNNLLSHYGLFDAKISASEKDLPVHRWCQTFFEAFLPQVSRFHWWSTYWSSNTNSYWLEKNGP